MKAETKKLINTLHTAKKSYTAIQTVLVAMDHCKNAKEADKLLAELGIAKAAASGKGIIDQMHARFEEGTMTQREFYDWVKEHGTTNTLRWFSSYDKIREMTNRMHVQLSGTEFTEVPMNLTDKEKEADKALLATKAK